MKWNWLLRVLLLPFLLVLLNGCAVTEQIKQNYQEASESYYMPEQLNGNPQDTGAIQTDVA